MQIRDVMTHTVEVVGPDTTLAEAAHRMRSLDVGSLPVRQADHLIGMITDRDITVRATAAGTDPKESTVRDVMTRDIVFCFEDQTIEQAARLMAGKQVRRLVVLNHAEQLAGIVSLGDLAVDTGDVKLAGETLQGVSAKPNSIREGYRRIIVALDGSKLAERVLPNVETLAKQSGSTVTLLRAVTPIEAEVMTEAAVGVASAARPPADQIPITDQMRWDANVYLTAVQHRLQSRGFQVECELPEGPAGKAIVQRARHLGADIIAMTTHGRTGLRRALFGSVAEDVLRTAPCPVLLVHVNEDR